MYEDKELFIQSKFEKLRVKLAVFSVSQANSMSVIKKKQQKKTVCYQYLLILFVYFLV